MKQGYLIIAGIIAVAVLAFGYAGASTLVMPALNNEAPVSQSSSSAIDQAAASDPIVGTWKMVNPVIKEGDITLDQTDARWTFGADHSYRQYPLLIDLFKTTGTWTKAGTDRYEVVCGKDSQMEHFSLVEGRLCSEEDPRYILTRAD